MKSWYVTVLKNYFTTEFEKECIDGPGQATEVLKEVKEKYKNDPTDPKAPKYSYHREFR